MRAGAQEGGSRALAEVDAKWSARAARTKAKHLETVAALEALSAGARNEAAAAREQERRCAPPRRRMIGREMISRVSCRTSCILKGRRRAPRRPACPRAAGGFPLCWFPALLVSRFVGQDLVERRPS
jgi:hypothetical protein